MAAEGATRDNAIHEREAPAKSTIDEAASKSSPDEATHTPRRRIMFHYTTHLRSRSRLFRRTVAIALGTGLVAVAGLGFSGTIAASNDNARGRGCTLATLKGQYLFADAGTLLPPLVPQPTLTAWAGFHVFNGDGTGTDVITGRAGGQIVLENVVSPTRYSVDADCTGSLTVLGGPTFSIFIATDGDSIATIATGPGGAGASVDWRVSRK
jgi:hypothetical protein